MATNKRKDRWLTVAIVVVALALAAAVFAGCGAEPDEIERSLAMAVVHKQDTSASGYSSTDDVHKTRVRVIPFQTAGGDGTGEAYTEMETRYRLLMSLLQQTMSGQIVRIDGGGLNVGMLASPDGNFDYWLNGTKYTVAEDDTFAVTAAVDNHISVDATGVLEKTSGAWPGTDHWKLAIVTCDGSEVTAIKDCRMENLDPAAANGWFNIAAGADVDMAAFGINDVENIDYVSASILTISAGSITPTQFAHTIAAESGTTDDMNTISGVAGERKLLLISADSGDTITVKPTGNIAMAGPAGLSVSLTGASYMLLWQTTNTTWVELFNNVSSVRSWAGAADANAYKLFQLGGLAFDEIEQTISAGVIDLAANLPLSECLIRVDTELDAASDDLDDLTNPIEGTIVILRPESAARTIVVKHAAGLIELATGADYSMTDLTYSIMLRYDSTNTTWYELSRSHWITENLVGTGKNVPYFCQIVAGTLVSGVALTERVLENRVVLPYAGTIEKVTGYVDTAPTGTSCIVDVKINGSSIFANQGEMVNIDAAANSDTSEPKNHAFSAGDVLTIEVQQLSAADDLVIVPHILCDLQAAP